MAGGVFRAPPVSVSIQTIDRASGEWNREARSRARRGYCTKSHFAISPIRRKLGEAPQADQRYPLVIARKEIVCPKRSNVETTRFRASSVASSIFYLRQPVANGRKDPIL